MSSRGVSLSEIKQLFHTIRVINYHIYNTLYLDYFLSLSLYLSSGISSVHVDFIIHELHVYPR